MKLPDLHSPLAEPIRHFVQYKRALNRKYRPEAAALRLFDRYLCEGDCWLGLHRQHPDRAFPTVTTADTAAQL